MATTAPWQAVFDPTSHTAGPQRDVWAPFARAPFRLVVTAALVPVLILHWGVAAAGLALTAAAMSIAVGRALQGWSGVVRRRVRACATVGDWNSAAAVELAAVLWAAVASALVLLVGLLALPAVAARLSLPRSPVPVDVENFLAFQLAMLVLWPPLTTWVAALDGRQGGSRADSWAGRYGLVHATTALGLPLLDAPPILLPLVSFLGTAALLMGVALLGARQLRQPGLGRDDLAKLAAELRRLPVEAGRSSWGEPGSAPLLTVAALPFALVHGFERALVPLATALMVQSLAECVSEWASRVQPLSHDVNLYADMYRARWRFQRMTDAAVLIACGAAIVLGAYGPGLVRGWLGSDPLAPQLAAAMALFVLASAPGGVAARWLTRGGQASAVAVVLRVDVTLAALLALLFAAIGNDSWSDLALLTVVVHGGLAGLVLPALAARALGVPALKLVLGRTWRYTLVALPAGLAAFAVSGMRPPRTLREWVIQLAVVAILYAVPGFTAWNLLDGGRRER